MHHIRINRIGICHIRINHIGLIQKGIPRKDKHIIITHRGETIWG